MCLVVFKTCECGTSRVQFHLRDNILQPEVIARLYCPACSGARAFDQAAMLNDNGWIIEYDMILARYFLTGRNLLLPEQIDPGYIFDQSYCTWLETYPGEREEIKAEREEILALQKSDRQRYLQEMISWNVKRIESLKSAGWRKASRA
jgi:hypothetical protein